MSRKDKKPKREFSKEELAQYMAKWKKDSQESRDKDDSEFGRLMRTIDGFAREKETVELTAGEFLALKRNVAIVTILECAAIIWKFFLPLQTFEFMGRTTSFFVCYLWLVFAWIGSIMIDLMKKSPWEHNTRFVIMGALVFVFPGIMGIEFDMSGWGIGVAITLMVAYVRKKRNEKNNI